MRVISLGIAGFAPVLLAACSPAGLVQAGDMANRMIIDPILAPTVPPVTPYVSNPPLPARYTTSEPTWPGEMPAQRACTKEEEKRAYLARVTGSPPHLDCNITE